MKKKLCLLISQLRKSHERRNIVGWFIQLNPFLFVRHVEFVFSKFLTTKAISIYGDGLVSKIIDCINKNFTTISILTTFLLVESRENVSEVDELRTFLLNLYGKFRGKEFIRAFMGSSKQSLELEMCQTNAVLSNHDRKSSDVYDKMNETVL